MNEHDDRIQRELTAAGYVGKFGLIVICILTGAFGAALGTVFIGMLFFMWLGDGWATFNWIAGGFLGALLGVGTAAQKIEEGNLKARALVNTANWRDSAR